MRHFPRSFVHPHAFPVTEYGQENTHIRIRVVFDDILDLPGLMACRRAADLWKKLCTEGQYSHGKQYPVYHYETIYIPEARVFQVDFDFLSVDDDVIEGFLFQLEEHLYWHGSTAKVRKTVVCYGRVGGEII